MKYEILRSKISLNYQVKLIFEDGGVSFSEAFDYVDRCYEYLESKEFGHELYEVIDSGEFHVKQKRDRD